MRNGRCGKSLVRDIIRDTDIHSLCRYVRNEETIFFDETAPEKSPPPAFNFVCCLNKSERFSKISRLKYIVVVGFVLIVDILFLLSYSIIQIFQYLHISQKNTNYYDPNDMLFLRYVLQILIGVHSVLQPLCYFRVRNFCRPLLFFDRLKKFGGKKKRRRKMTTTRRNHQNNISVSNNGNYCQTAGKISRNMSRDASKKFSDKNFTFSNRKIRVDSMERRNKRLASSSIDEL
uniref:Uncharacterized protein n=1 Tax=Romanomermis culicivorax TaxID=13658 RepID=A0A915IEP9_ROMCU